MARKPTKTIRGRTARTNVAGSNRRLLVGRMLLVIALVLTSAKLIEVQGFRASALSKEAVKQRLDRSVIPADRGSIVDRTGNVLAFSSEARQLFANPRQLTTTFDEQHAKDPSKPTAAEYKQEIARFIAKELPGVISEQEVLDALFRDVGFTYFGPKIDPSKAREITKKYPHIGSEYQATREYPGGDLAANIIGAANWRKDEVPGKLRGQIGLESSMDSVLAGKDGQQVSDTALGSDLVIPGTRELEPAIPGSDVELTIDSDVQYMLQRELADYTREAQAKNASAVVLDAKTGEVYALANDKTFDPNGPWGENTGNPAVTTPYEPGSVAKLITAAGAIETGVMKPDTVLQVPGSIKVADRTVGDAWPHGTVPMTFTGVMGKSSNVGTLMAAQQMGEQRWYDFARAFGLGQRTGVGLPGESAGVLPPPDKWSGSSFGNLPIGQGFSMTVLQMASMYQAIANDGVRVPPRIVAAEVGPDGKRVERPRPEGVRVVSPETARTVNDMLRSVVQDAPQPNRGTGPGAALPGFQVSGKTGTAQQYDPDCKCYSNSKHWITFAGVVPADSPRFVIGLMLDRPAYGTQEGSSAAPLFHNIAAFLTQRYQLPLSKEEAPFQVLQLPTP
ncbi:cell division protein FtsI (penicillin-binding protein 3) [Saccharopolyspora antimicrobica]|uniref:Cell division protein FtsI (Penicillin-binding protein 3) n=1 Tax=Saccharopolyspora antimicrobica TaxID=455193 RepID=A0A1I5LGK1_9PSEU|nr:penicillin-binding protein 2 [Saccharopolyspora antimicrobica]RKT86073.1 cell division protein FtsI (penicillin-binding protein 3) [Saccharopolyspora antimicrobica]SFO96418.1 cell division protein FtsI (penicillin-binding protein 3) [Saccharopolyspora antimicrobica]